MKMSESCSQEQGLSPRWTIRYRDWVRAYASLIAFPKPVLFWYNSVYNERNVLQHFENVCRVKRIMGSTAILSLFLTQSSESSFRSFFLMKSCALSRKLRGNTRLLSSPPKLINQLDQQHLQLFPTWTTSGKGTTNSNSDGSSLLSAMSLKQTSPFLLQSSQSVATTITTNF